MFRKPSLNDRITNKLITKINESPATETQKKVAIAIIKSGNPIRDL